MPYAYLDVVICALMKFKYRNLVIFLKIEGNCTAQEALESMPLLASQLCLVPCAEISLNIIFSTD